MKRCASVTSFPSRPCGRSMTCKPCASLFPTRRLCNLASLNVPSISIAYSYSSLYSELFPLSRIGWWP